MERRQAVGHKCVSLVSVPRLRNVILCGMHARRENVSYTNLRECTTRDAVPATVTVDVRRKCSTDAVRVNTNTTTT